MKKRIEIKNIIKPLAFILTVILAVYGASYALAPKRDSNVSGGLTPVAKGFISEPERSIDVIVIGNSDAYSGFSPMELWNKYGYTSYVGAESKQLISGSISMLSKVFECQSPKVVILEADGLFTKADTFEKAFGAVNSLTDNGFSVFKYHNRWKTMDPADILKPLSYTGRCPSKGQYISNDVVGYFGKEYMNYTDKKQSLPEDSVKGLEQISAMCEENGAKLLLVEMPSQSSWNYKKHNGIKDWAKSHGVDFIDLNIDRDEFGFDWTTDSRDGGNHLNCRGARKTTLYIGEYLRENFELEDHREDKSYEAWCDDWTLYENNVKI